jgi:hypothetical protein
MEKELFDELIESIKEAGAIQRGEKKPSREFYFPHTEPYEPERRFAICVQTDDPELLQPRKVYQIDIYQNDLVGVIDEAGESAIYPADHFVLIDLPSNVKEALQTFGLVT